jgi:glycosyltransferase involved in cell wall biosynthesis
MNPACDIYPGFLAEIKFVAALSSCRALISPSLYEGFGILVLEAMAFERPVLGNNVISLLEIAGVR